jgi:MscS family membrane protein
MRYWWLLTLLACVVPAQTPATAPASADVRSTPRGSVIGFLEACRDREYRRAASFLQLRRGTDGPELARQFKEVLDSRLHRDLATLSAAPEGDLTDGLEPENELLGTVDLGSRRVDLMLTRVPLEGQQVWLVSSGTVQMIPLLHDSLDSGWIEQRLPAWLRAPGPVDTAVWVWFGLVLLAVLGYSLGTLLAGLVLAVFRRIVARTRSQVDDQLVASVSQPMRLLMALAAVRSGLAWLTPSVLLRAYIVRTLTALSYFGIAWLIVRVIDVISVRALSRMTGRQRASASSMIPLAKRSAKVAVFAIALLATLASWGYDTTAILAGLGVGGLAVALAAQKTIENLFGGVAITTDKPVLVGDFCRYGDKFGTVEDIGLRSTRVRTLDRTVVTIPNGQFSALEIENFGRRDKIFFHPILNLRRDTTPDQIRLLITQIRELLLAHPQVDPNPARVRFIGIGQYSLDIEIFSYTRTANIDEFLVIQEELLLSILDLVRQAGTALAVPSQLTVLSRDPLDAGRGSTKNQQILERA